MTLQLQRPILVGGLGLTASLWLLESLHPSSLHFGGTAIMGAIALGSSVWWLRQQTRPSLDLGQSAVPVSRTVVETELTAIQTLLHQLTTDGGDSISPDTIIPLTERLTSLTADMDRTQIRLSVMGGKSVGKTTLTQQLATYWSSTPATSSLVDSKTTLGETDATTVDHADLVLFLTTGDLTDSEFQAIDQIRNRQQRVLLLFNKQDQYLPAERLVILQQLRDRLQGLLAAEDVVAIATNPAPFKVRQHQPDGQVQERLEQPAPDLTELTGRLGQLLPQDGRQLILSTVLRQAIALKADVLSQLNTLRRDRALPLIEQAQWIAAAAAFANPVPSLDLLATVAINTQLVMDLGAIYQQTFSLQQAKTAAGALTQQVVKLGLVELATQAIAPLLKSNTLTYVAGGLLQGVSAAYLTRIAGLCLVDYFVEQSQSTTVSSELPLQLDRLAQKLKAVFQDNQRTAFVQTLVKQGIQRLTPELS